MLLARSTTVDRFYAPFGNNITKLEFEVYQETNLIYSGNKLNYTISLNTIEFDLSIFARDLIQPLFPKFVNSVTYDGSLFVSLGFAFRWTNGVDTFGGLGIENAIYFNFVYGYFNNSSLIKEPLSNEIDYSDIVSISSSFVLMNEGSYNYLASDNAGGIWVDSLGTTTAVTYTGLVSGATETINLNDEFKGVPCVHPTFQSQGNSVSIVLDGGTPYTFVYSPISECKYEPLKVDFINNLGGWQRTWLFKASNEMISQKREQYSRGFNRHQYINGDSPTKVFNVETTKSIKGNSGWVDEQFNSLTLEPLMNSETVFVNDKPVILKTQSMELVKHVNQKMINYSLEFEYAFNTIYK